MRLFVNALALDVRRYHANMPKNKTLREVVGENVTRIMKAKNLRQQEVEKNAKRHGTKVHQTSVGRVARAVYPASVDTIEAVANGLSVQPWQLLIPEGTEQSFLAILEAWSVSSEAGRKLLSFAAEAARNLNADRKTERGSS